MVTTTNILGLSEIFPMRNRICEFLGEDMKSRNCRKPYFEPHLFPYVVSDMLDNKYIARPEELRVVENGSSNNSEKTNNTDNNNDCNNYDSYRYCNDNYDNNHCIGNVVRLPFMYFFNFKLKMNKNINKNIFRIMLWLSERTYKPFASAHRVGEAYGKEGYGDKNGLRHSKAIQAVSEVFSHIRRLDVHLSVKTRLKRIFGAFAAIMDISPVYPHCVAPENKGITLWFRVC